MMVSTDVKWSQIDSLAFTRQITRPLGRAPQDDLVVLFQNVLDENLLNRIVFIRLDLPVITVVCDGPVIQSDPELIDLASINAVFALKGAL